MTTTSSPTRRCCWPSGEARNSTLTGGSCGCSLLPLRVNEFPSGRHCSARRQHAKDSLAILDRHRELDATTRRRASLERQLALGSHDSARRRRKQRALDEPQVTHRFLGQSRLELRLEPKELVERSTAFGVIAG